MIPNAALTRESHRTLVDHLVRDDGQEDVCFALYRPSTGRDRRTALISEPILPLPGERLVHGNTSFLPAYFQRAVALAHERGTGLVLLHSHPAPGWQSMSPDDIAAEEDHAAAAYGATGMPLLGATIGTDGALSARFWERHGRRAYHRTWCENVRVIGPAFGITFHPLLRPPPSAAETQTRTVSSWGTDIQATIARLRIGVIGAGSVGALIAETLARTGFGDVRLIDFDSIEIINLDRLLHANRRSIRLARSKVENLAHALQESATAPGFHVEPLELSVVEHEGLAAALDCDILFSCVDRPWPRYVLNVVAYAHLIPVIDGGISIETHPDGRLRRATWRAHVVGPERRCLACLGQYNPELVQVDRQGLLEVPTYIAGLPRNHQLRQRENVFAFSMATASMEIGQALSMLIAPSGSADVGAQTHHFVPGTLDQSWEPCTSHCNYPTKHLAQGDTCVLSPHITVPIHPLAERARNQRHRRQKHPRIRIERTINHWLSWPR